MPLLEIDEALVNKADFEAAKNGDKAAAARIGRELDGVQLYMHVYSVPLSEWADTHTIATVRDLEIVGAIKSIDVRGARSPEDVVPDPMALEEMKKRDATV